MVKKNPKPCPEKSIGNLTGDFREKGRIPEVTFCFTQPLTRSEPRRKSSTNFHQVPPSRSAVEVSSHPSTGVIRSGL